LSVLVPFAHGESTGGALQQKMRAGEVLARTPSLVGYDRLTSKRRYAHYRRLRNLLAGRFAIMTNTHHGATGLDMLRVGFDDTLVFFEIDLCIGLIGFRRRMN
jgi:hypothetical protein